MASVRERDYGTTQSFGMVALVNQVSGFELTYSRAAEYRNQGRDDDDDDAERPRDELPS